MRAAAKHKELGGALPLTLLLIAFNLVVLVALLLYSATEQTASRNSVNAEAARVMALNGIEMAGALIAQNSTNNAYVTYQNITNVSGDRLETKIANTVTNGNQWTRMVEKPTALHSGFATNGEERVDLNYATAGDTNSGYIAPRTNPTNVGSTWTNLHPNMFQMKWVDVYKGDTNKQTNLIGRFAFWVDDESTKLNLNYSGATNNYDASWNLKMSGITTYLPKARTNLEVTTNAIGYTFSGNTWPLFVDLGGIAGISRTNMLEVLKKRGTPWSHDSPTSPRKPFSPFYSTLEIRSANSNVVTNVSEQSQLALTATMFSREPELSFAKGIPRFDMFKFNSENTAVASNRPQLTNEFIKALTNNYPKFWDKYSLPQYANAVLTFYRGPDETNTFTYSVVGGEVSNFVTKARPYLNELGIKLDSSLNVASNQQTSVLTFEAELITLGTSVQGSRSMYDKLGAAGSSYSNNIANYAVNLDFAPALVVNGQSISNLVMRGDPTRWFAEVTNKSPYSSDIMRYVRVDSQDLTNCFGVLTNSTNFSSPAQPNQVVWQLPSTINATVSYGADQYQTIAPVDVSGGGVTNTNYLTNDGITRTLFHVTSLPRGDLGVRSDPRLGLHQASVTAAPNATNASNVVTANFTNSAASMFSINKTWRESGVNKATGPWSANYLAEAMSPDITPPATLFVSDRGIKLIADGRYFYKPDLFPQSAGELGDIPITAFHSGTNLAWSTPKFWGDGRTNMGDNETYPPDWLMLDAVHSAFLPPQAHTNRVFTRSANVDDFNLEHIQNGRLNVNSLKTHFQKRLGTQWRADTIMDSMLVGVHTKDFFDDYLQPPNNPSNNLATTYKLIEDGSSSRINILNYVHTNAVAKNASDNPYLHPLDFVANLAGNTNTNFTSLINPNTGYWMAYFPGSETTSDRRIETLVKGLQQRLTTRGWQFNVYSMGQALQVFDAGGGTYKTNVLGEAFMQAVWERAPKHDTTSGEIVNKSDGGAPPMRMLYMREIR